MVQMPTVRFGKYLLVDEIGGLAIAHPQSEGGGAVALPDSLAICRWPVGSIDPQCGPDCDCLECPPGNPQFHRRCAELLPQLPFPVHPNLIRLFAIGRIEDWYFVALQLVRGVQLGWPARQGALLPIPLAIYIAAEVARGLAALHALPPKSQPGLVHANLSPAAILLTADGQVIVSSLIRSPVLKGNIDWLTPDQLHDAPCDPRTDLFALGMVLYTLLTGQHIIADDARGGAQHGELLSQFTATPPSTLRRDVPPQLDRIVMRALARPLAQRYPDAVTLERELRQVLAAVAPRFAQSDLAQYLQPLDLPLHPAMP